MQKKLVFVLITLVFVILFLFVTTPFNLGVNTDSVSYIEVAQNMSNGKGLVNNAGALVNHWPPFYPMLLGGFSYVSGLDVLQIGVYVNLFLHLIYGACFLFILHELKVLFYVRLLFFSMLLFSIPTTEFFMFLSEGLFAALTVAIVFVLLLWLRIKSVKFLILAGVLSGCLLLTRYAGAGFIGGFVLLIYVFHRESFLKKIGQICIYILPIVIMLSLWLLYSATFETEVIDRTFVWHPIEASKFKFALSVLYDWFSGHVVFAVLLLALSVFGIFKGITLKGQATLLNNNMLLFMVLPIVCYLAFIMFSISFFDAHTPLDYRILMPIYPLVLVAMALIFNSRILFAKSRQLRFFMLTVLAVSTSVSAIQPWKHHYDHGIGLTGKLWQKSEALNYLKTHPDVPLFSNGLDVVHYFSDIACEFIPRKFDANLNTTNENFRQEVALMKLAVAQKQKQILYLDKITWRSYLMSQSELLDEFEDFEIIYFEDGFLIK